MQTEANACTNERNDVRNLVGLDVGASKAHWKIANVIARVLTCKSLISGHCQIDAGTFLEEVTPRSSGCSAQ